MMSIALTFRQKVGSDRALLAFGLWGGLGFFACCLLFPLAALLLRAFQNAVGDFVGLDNFRLYITTPALRLAAWNSLWTAAATTTIVVPLALVYAYALTRSCIPGRAVFRAVMMVPLLAPSLLPALALIQLFGNQGLLRGWWWEGSIYGAAGIIAAQTFYCFPAATMILAVALVHADARLYEAAQTLRASRLRIHLTVTLPALRYGLISASVVVFTLVITDFGIPKVIGGQFPVLATDIYKQVIGQQNFNMGAVVGLVLLTPTVFAFLLDRWASQAQRASLSGRSVPFRPTPRLIRDLPLFLFCLIVAALLISIVATAVWGSLVRFWPYDLSLTLAHYDFSRYDAQGWGTVLLSLQMAAAVALLGTPAIFLFAYVLERGGQHGFAVALGRLSVILPLAVPGLVLGLGYVVFFNHPANPLGFLYGTVAILTLNTIVHFYTVGHYTAVAAIKQLDPEFEAVSASLGVPMARTMARVTLPLCLPAILEIAAYLFLNAMTTVSGVIFLYGPENKPASVAMVHMDEAGQAAAAAGLGTIILAIGIAVKVLQLALGAVLERSSGAWRR